MSGVPTLWHDPAPIRLLGSSSAYPGSSVSTSELLAKMEEHFQLRLGARAAALARRLKVEHRFLSRPFRERVEGAVAPCGNADLVANAVRKALEEAGETIDTLAYLIGHTATPATHLPSNITHAARLLDARCPVAEFRQACTGFVNAVIFARGLLSCSHSARIAVTGSETGSVFFDPLRAAEDEGQLVSLLQMGDGAAAIILCSGDTGSTLRHLFHGRLEVGVPAGLSMPLGGSESLSLRAALVPEFEHRFAEIREHGPELLLAGLAAAQSVGTDLDRVDWVLPHQATGCMDSLLAPHLPKSARVMVHADHVGDTGSAAIWLALDAMRRFLESGQTVLVLGAEATNYSFGGFLYQH